MKYLISTCALIFSTVSCGGKNDNNSSSSNYKPKPNTVNNLPPTTEPEDPYLIGEELDKIQKSIENDIEKIITISVSKNVFDMNGKKAYTIPSGYHYAGKKINYNEVISQSVEFEKRCTIENIKPDTIPYIYSDSYICGNNQKQTQIVTVTNSSDQPIEIKHIGVKKPADSHFLNIIGCITEKALTSTGMASYEAIKQLPAHGVCYIRATYLPPHALSSQIASFTDDLVQTSFVIETNRGNLNVPVTYFKNKISPK